MLDAELYDTVHEGEALEAMALSSLHAVAGRPLAARLGLAWREIGGAYLSIAAALPASAIVVNRALPADPAQFDPTEIARFYDARGAARNFLSLPVEKRHQGWAKELTAAGYAPARGWQKFLRPAGVPTAEVCLPDGVQIVRLAPDDAGLAADAAAIVADAFDLGHLAGPWLARLVEDPDWVVFAALDESRAVATGSLYRQGAAGWIDWDATSPGHRGRGLQRALLAARAAHADAAGLLRLHTCTGVAVPGDPQHSYYNIRRAGFVETVVRDNLARPAGAQGSATDHAARAQII